MLSSFEMRIRSKTANLDSDKMSHQANQRPPTQDEPHGHSFISSQYAQQ